MRWILQWLFDDLLRFFGPFVTELHSLREGMSRARRRREHHGASAREAAARAEELLTRVRAMEVSAEADVSELVNARKELMAAEGDVRHHRARANQAEEALRLMKVDRGRMEAGEPAAHREAYQELLNH